MANVYVGEEELPNDSQAIRLGLMALGRLSIGSPTDDLPRFDHSRTSTRSPGARLSRYAKQTRPNRRERFWPAAKMRVMRRRRRPSPAPEEPIRLSPYDPAWPARFEQERAVLAEAIGEWVVGGIHHVGSTAVPGLEAKPIIDILAGVADLEASRAGFGPLADAGYLYAPYRSEEMHWFCKPDPSHRTHHLHLVPVGSRRYEEELAFRDRLRADPTVAGEYAALKRDLAARFENDREGYTDAKAGFIRRTLDGE